MNTLMMVVVVLVVFCYFGGKYCPSVLKKNKEMLLGVAGGLVLCSFFGLRLEGLDLGQICKADDQCDSGYCHPEKKKCVDGRAHVKELRQLLEDDSITLEQRTNVAEVAAGAAVTEDMSHDELVDRARRVNHTLVCQLYPDALQCQ